jgi:YbgC/YbaW family acyl-CoA thioester hydrolase
MAHRFDVAVRFYELDPYHHVNHAVYFSYFETARIALLAEAGLTMEGMQDDGLMIVVAELSAQFRRPAVEGDRLVVETAVLEFGRVTSRWRQRLLRGDESLVQQDVVAAFTDLEGRPQRFPERFRELLAPYGV